MNVENRILEDSCTGFNNTFSNYFYWNDIDLSFTKVDIGNKDVSVI